jgi:hypothetical protein
MSDALPIPFGDRLMRLFFSLAAEQVRHYDKGIDGWRRVSDPEARSTLALRVI